jgi:glutathione S-transferase
MKLYYMPGACSLAAHIILEWTGAPYETQRLSHGELKSEAYLAVNPLGAVPALEIDGSVLTQNAGVLNYLAERYPAAKLGGDGTARGNAEVHRWLGFVNSDMHPAFKPLFGATGYLDDAAAIDKSKVRAKKTVRRLFEEANRQLRGRDWIAGQRSIADAYLFVMTRWTKGVGIDISDLTEVGRFFDRMNRDPGVAKALKDEGLAA